MISPPAGARDANILVFDEQGLGTPVAGEDETHGADGCWHMSLKHEKMRHPNLV